jgi:hypothetical protein
MLAYAPCVSQKLKQLVWTQLRLEYTMKQIYYKHKNIKWEWVDVSECMIQDDFL